MRFVDFLFYSKAPLSKTSTDLVFWWFFSRPSTGRNSLGEHFNDCSVTLALEFECRLALEWFLRSGRLSSSCSSPINLSFSSSAILIFWRRRYVVGNCKTSSFSDSVSGYSKRWVVIVGSLSNTGARDLVLAPKVNCLG